MIKVLIVNDSVMVQQLLKRIIDTDPQLQTAGVAGDGEEGVRLARIHAPDVILMDIRMPVMNGVEAVREIMQTNPRPILIVTATLRAHMPYIYDCLNLGALEVIKTPGMLAGGAVTSDKAAYEKSGKELLERIHIAASLKSTISKAAVSGAKPAKEARLTARPEHLIKGPSSLKVVAIGASTGGPNAILEILKRLPDTINAGIVLIQHIDAEFAPGLAEWLTASCHWNVFPAKEGDLLVKKMAYLAAQPEHLVLTSEKQLKYEKAASNEIHVPSIDRTFRSIAQIYGKNAIGVLLTGMGSDGARGLLEMRNAGAQTIAQDQTTSLIYGMPKAAKDLDACEHILPLYNIADKICELLE